METDTLTVKPVETELTGSKKTTSLPVLSKAKKEDDEIDEGVFITDAKPDNSSSINSSSNNGEENADFREFSNLPSLNTLPNGTSNTLPNTLSNTLLNNMTEDNNSVKGGGRKISTSSSVHFLEPPMTTSLKCPSSSDLNPVRKISTVSAPFQSRDLQSDRKQSVSSAPFFQVGSPDDDNDKDSTTDAFVPLRRISSVNSSRNRRSSSRPPRQSVAVPQPPDGGWGWVIVFAAFVSCAGVVGLTRAFGIIYVEILDAFPESTALAASWIPGIYNTLSTGLAPVAGALSNRFSPRSVVFVGGLLMSCGLVLNYFATSVEYLYISFGVITGCGAGMCTTPGIIMVARYFKKRRALANGLCLAGTSSGAFIQPLIVEFLTNKYGFRGAMLIMGGIMLHISAFSLLYRPLEAPGSTAAPRSNAQIPSSRRLQRKDKDGCAKKYCWLLNCLLDKNALTCFQKKKKHDRNQDDAKELAEVNKSMLPQKTKEDFVTIAPASVMPSVVPTIVTTLSVPRIVKSSEDEQDDEDVTDYDDDYQDQENGDQLMKTKTLCLDHSINDLHTVSAAQYQDSIRRRISLGQESRRMSNKPAPKQPTGLKRYIDYSLFRNRAFVLFVASSAFTSVGYPHASVFMPAYATTSLGISKKDTGLLLSVTAGADLVGRIGFGWLADQNFFQRIHGYMFNVAMTATATLTIPFATTYAGLVVNSAFYGLGVGSFFMLTPVILTDHHGAEKVASSYGLVRLFHGVMSIVTPPIAGLIRDGTGEYTGAFMLMGAVMMVGSLIMFFMPSALRYEERLEQRRKSTYSSVSLEAAANPKKNDRRRSSLASWGGRYSADPKDVR